MSAQKLNFKSLFVGFLLLLLLQPFFIWSNINVVSIIAMLVLFFIFILDFRLNSNFDLLLLFFFTLSLMIGAIDAGSNLIGIFFMMLLIVAPFIKFNVAYKYYRAFKLIYSTILFFSIISFILVIFLKVGLPYKLIPPLNTLKDHYYAVYPFLVTPYLGNSLLDVSIYRFCGIFDEPGVVGTISALFLFAERFQLKNKQNMIIFVSGLLSLSLFFYIASFIYLAIYSSNKVRIIQLFLIVIFYIFTSSNPVLNTMIWGRVKWDENNKTIAGNNRSSSDLDDYYEQIKGSQTYYWGGTDADILLSFSGDASYKNLILTYGIIPCILYIVFFIMFAYKYLYRKKEVLAFLLVFFLTLYQRPSIYNFVYIFLFSAYIIIGNEFYKISNKDHLKIT